MGVVGCCMQGARYTVFVSSGPPASEMGSTRKGLRNLTKTSIWPSYLCHIRSTGDHRGRWYTAPEATQGQMDGFFAPGLPADLRFATGLS